MFGSTNAFGQSPNNNPFGTQSQSLFGQNNNASSNNPFAPKPFGASAPFGAQTGSSMFGGTSTGVFGAPQASSSTFGTPSQGFGSSTPAFGASSAPAFGSSPSPFGAASAFGQNSFGVSTPQTSPFGSTTQPSQPAFGNSTFGSSTPFGASNTSAFGASSTPAFGASSTPAFGASNTPAFGSTSTPTFGATNTSAFGTSSTPAFGSTNTGVFGASSTPSFGTTNSPGFGSSPTQAFGNNAFGNNAFSTNTSAFGTPSTSAFGTSSTPAFGASSSPAFGTSSTPAFGASSSPAFGASSTPSFSFGSSPAFANGSFAPTQSPFGAQGAQASTPTFGAQQEGSRVMPYTPTTETDPSSQPAGKVQSISAMPVHKDKRHEELRWEDYQKGDKGGQRPSGQSPGGATFGVPNPQPNLFSQTPSFSQTSASSTSTNPFGSTSTNPFSQKTPTPASNFAAPFGQNSNTPVFGQTTSTTTSGFGSSPGFATTTSQPFGSSSTPGFSSSPSLFASAPAQVSTPTFNSNFNNSQTSSAFGQPQATSLFGQPQTTSSFGQPQATSAINTNPGFAQTSSFSTPSTGFNFSSSSSLTTSPSPFTQTTPAGLAQPYQSAHPTQPQGAFSFNNSGQTQTANNTAAFTNGMGSFSQGNFGPAPANNAVMQPTPMTNPFGTLPAMPQVSITQGGRSSPSIQYGISSMPIVDKPAPARVSSLFTSRHLLQRRVKLPARKYRPNDDGPKVLFFSDEVENSYTPKADAVFVPRENPRALFIRPLEKEKLVVSKDGPTPLQENAKSSNGVNNGTNHENKDNIEASPKLNGSDIASLLPKLHHAEYFTEPRVQELAAKEKANPGYCSRVKDFVIGRHGYGNIKFLGETDVRSLDIEALVQFNNREVIVYMDESLKPTVGQGLNKPSEVTLLNIKCVDKKTGKQVKEEGARLDKYKEMLKRKGEEQGAEFVSYDCVSGAWKFKVEHF